MQQLGINTIRVYNLDANLDHNECASIFDAAGIYMLLDVNSGLSGQYIDRSNPSSTYTLSYLEHVFGIIEAMAPFPNTIGFFAGNEVINQNSTTDAASYVRAVVRDMKEYIANNIARSVPVGYSAADVSTLLEDTYNYFACSLSGSPYSKIDFFGLNDYEWCGDSSFTQSGYDNLVTMFGETSIPVFFSEYGCNAVEPRTFTNVPVLYGPEMSVLSGGLVYEYSQDVNNYGLVVINSSSELTLISDYNYLAVELDTIDIASLTAVNKTATAMTPTACASSLVTGTGIAANWNLPAAPSGASAIIASGISNPNRGSLVKFSSSNSTAETATVYNSTGATISGLKLAILNSNDYNYPGLLATYSASSGAGTSPTATPATTAKSTKTTTASTASSTKTSAAVNTTPRFGIAGLSVAIALLLAV